jgi:transposase
VGEFEPRVDPEVKPLPPDSKKSRNHAKKRKKRAKKQPGTREFDLRTEVYKVFGVDVTQIPGLEFLALLLFSEVGRDMSRWKNAACFVSWLALCPDNDISGGRVLWRGARKAHNRAGQLFRMAAYSLDRSATPLGDYLRRMKAKIGPQAAHTATAHKIAVIFYAMVKNQVEYDQTIWEKRNEQRRERHTASLKRQAQRLGYKLIPMEEKSAA